MKSISFVYNTASDLSNLEIFKNEDNLLVQVFCNEIVGAGRIINEVKEVLPKSKIILSSIRAGFSQGEIYDNNIIINVSAFSATKVETLCVKSSDEVSKKILNFITPDTKLLILFNNIYLYNAISLIDDIFEQYPNVVVSGGNIASSDIKHSVFVGNEDGVSNNVIVCARLDSSILRVYSGYILEWLSVGPHMRITKAKGDTIYTINDMPAYDVYKKYLGLDSNENKIYSYIDKDGISIARGLKNINDDGSITYFGAVEQDVAARFAIHSLSNIDVQMNDIASKLIDKGIESIFLYACVGGYIYFGKNILNEYISYFNKFAPTSGLFLNGEFYHHKNKNYIFNYGCTYVAISEVDEANIAIPKIEEFKSSYKWHDDSINVLTHLNDVVNDDYEDAMQVSKQYQAFLFISSMIINVSRNGAIIFANDNFLSASGYSLEQIREMNAYDLFIDNIELSKVANILQENGVWNGELQFIDTNGHVFYTKAAIMPIKTKKDILFYTIYMMDINDQVCKVKKLSKDIKFIDKILHKKNSLIQDYQTLLYKSTPVVKINKEKIVDMSDTFLSLLGYSRDELLGKHFSFILDKEYNGDSAISQMRTELIKSGYGKFNFYFSSKEGKSIYIQAYLMVIGTSSGYFSREIIGILHDVTDVLNAQKELEHMQREVIFAMGSISEGRSRETGNHVKRVSKYTHLLATFYGLDKSDAELLEIASPMHDIGKLAIPDSILHKPGKLTDEEFEVMKTHTLRGFEMLNFSNREIIKTAAQIALTHHEWWNGNGYPYKVAGYAIPLSGRITAVADVFDALSNDRCYKKAWPIDEVVEYMKKSSGVQFEPKLIDLLVDNLDKFVQIKIKLKDEF